MWHPSPGFSGVVVGPLVFGSVWTICCLNKEFESYNLDPGQARSVRAAPVEIHPGF